MGNFENKVVYGESSSNFNNIYFIHYDFAELHILGKGPSGEKHYVIKIDKSDVEKMKGFYWQIVFSGRTGHKKPQVYRYIGKVKQYLSDFLIERNGSSKIIFLNRDPFDFRRSNLVRQNNNEPDRHKLNRKGKTGMNGIGELTRNGELYGYIVYYTDNGIKKTKCFNINKIGTPSQTLRQARNFRDSQFRKCK